MQRILNAIKYGGDPDHYAAHGLIRHFRENPEIFHRKSTGCKKLHFSVKF